ncbi:MAG: glycosyltransferase [Desulfomicrobium sp.]|nr:glycosyltransferase [Desulfomicrobium sp.]
MRILQVIYCFGIGGSESVARDIALNMTEGCTHGVAALEHDGPLRQVLEAGQVATFLIDKKPTERFSPMLRLWRAMRQFKPDVVHTHHLYELFYAWPGALLSRTHIVHTEHEYFSLISSKACFRLRQLSRFCSAVTGVNEETSAFLRDKVGIPAHKVHTVVNGIDLARFQQTGLDRKALGLSEDDLVAGIVARLHPVKDHAMLLNAFRLVADQEPRAKLLIIGDGTERGKLEQQADQLGLGGHVRFLGARSDVPDILQCLDVFVLSSKEEGLPLCILEAMAAGLPVVATNVGGIPSVVRPDDNGMLVDPEDSRAMANALLSLFSDKEKRIRLGMNGRRLVEQHYDLKHSIAAYTSLYKAEVN